MLFLYSKWIKLFGVAWADLKGGSVGLPAEWNKGEGTS